MGTPGKQCQICAHRERSAIDLAIVRGTSYVAIAKRYSLGSTQCISRHKDKHLSPVQKAKLLAGPNLDIDLDKLKETEGQSLLMHLIALRHRLFAHLDTAEENEDSYWASRAVSQIHSNLELTGKLLGELGVGPVSITNILVLPEYTALRLALVNALKAFPDAAAAVAKVLNDIEAKAIPEIEAGPKYASGPAERPKMLELEAAHANDGD